MAKKENRTYSRRIRSSYFTSIISISLVLLLLGMVGLLLINGRNIKKQVMESIGFNVILKENVKEADIYQLQKILDSKDYILSTEYITKEEAALETEQMLGEDFIRFLGYNPLPPSIRVRLNQPWAKPDSVMLIEQDLLQYDSIEEVYYKKSLLYAINENVRQISLVILGFSLLLTLISVTLINNTIRLSIYSKRFIINTMQLVGATRGFIRRPFLFKGAASGFTGSLVALSILFGIVYLLQEEFEGVISLRDYEMLAILALGVILMGLLINWISTFFAVNKYLNIKTDKLY
ncbi:MAG: permease-like cell division protein FtsX [Bacteroidales bacterium]|nr:permease-like cell division protein FtsX [Bacteroidales bacterium]